MANEKDNRADENAITNPSIEFQSQEVPILYESLAYRIEFSRGILNLMQLSWFLRLSLDPVSLLKNGFVSTIVIVIRCADIQAFLETLVIGLVDKSVAAI